MVHGLWRQALPKPIRHFGPPYETVLPHGQLRTVVPENPEAKKNNKESKEMLKQKYTVTVEELDITIETGTIAKQANGCVTIRLGETILLVAATAAEDVRPDQDFFPLTVDYREKFYAAGRFPGGFFKRESRPSEKEILTSRLCDRPIRPLFPKGFINEVQILGTLITTDLINEPDILMVNGASAALMISDLPWNGPIGCVRVGEINGEFVANPTNEQIFESNLDLVYAGNSKEMLMIEGNANQMPEERFIEALAFAQEKVSKIIDAQIKLAEMVGKPKREFKCFDCDPEVLDFVRQHVGDRMEEAVFKSEKLERSVAVNAIKSETEEKLIEKVGEENYDPNQLRLAFEVLQEEVYRTNILEHGRRVDGRGSALFQRGETQNIVITTLGTSSDTQSMDGLTGGARSKSFLLHYNFPPFSVGETKRFLAPGRREIGHGALAERSLLPVIPTEDNFPYSVRLVSEIMESNGSSSMASVCGGCLALMDAGVPITDMVAGISAGLVSKSDDSGKIVKYVILTDIIGSEDHFGDMDFKICGTRKGITGFQLDLKISGLPLAIAEEAIYRNQKVRMKILDIMSEELAEPRPDLGDYAPRIHQMKIDPEKIGALIGPGGRNIRRITEISGAQIDIGDDNTGKIFIFASSKESIQRAIEEVELSTGEIEVDRTYRGIVRGVKEFGCFVECIPGKEGLVHISEMADFRVRSVEDVCKVGDEMLVKCIEIDNTGRVRLSRRAAMADLKEGETGDELDEKLKAQAEDSSSDHRDDRRGGDRPRRGGFRGDSRREGGRHRDSDDRRDGGRRFFRSSRPHD